MSLTASISIAEVAATTTLPALDLPRSRIPLQRMMAGLAEAVGLGASAAAVIPCCRCTQPVSGQRQDKPRTRRRTAEGGRVGSPAG